MLKGIKTFVSGRDLLILDLFVILVGLVLLWINYFQLSFLNIVFPDRLKDFSFSEAVVKVEGSPKFFELMSNVTMFEFLVKEVLIIVTVICILKIVKILK
ncbi:MAG: hypothetical protein WC604_03085 [Candidatus Gracilibacteria bacterium]